MKLMKVVLIFSVLLTLGAAPAYASHSYEHPKVPDLVLDKVITKVPPNATDPGTTTLGNITEPDILGTITNEPEVGGSVLPFTGAELSGITLIGVTAIGLGMVLARARRRSS